VEVWDSVAAVSRLVVPAAARTWGGACGGERWTKQCVPVDAARFGVTWWHAQVLSVLLRPNEELETRVRRAGVAWSALAPVLRVGMHMRGGHKYIEIPPAPPCAYAWQLERLVYSLFHLDVGVHTDVERKKTRDRLTAGAREVAVVRGETCVSRDEASGSRGLVGKGRRKGGGGGLGAGGGEGIGVGVFVATENDGALRSIREAASVLSVSTHLVDAHHRRPNLRISVPMAIRVGILDAHRENLVSLVSLFVLARYSDVFLGSFSSGYSRLVMELAVAERARVLPHTSLDVAWAF
jgi:hypothetical protein